MGPTDTRPRRRRPKRPQLIALSVAVVAIVAIGTGLVVRGAPSTKPTRSGAAAASGAPSEAPGGSATPTVPNGEWAAVELGPRPVMATLEPGAQDTAGVAGDSTFTLTSQTAESAAAMAATRTIARTRIFFCI